MGTNVLVSELNARIELLDKSSLISITDKKGIIIYVNELFCKTTSFSRSELIGKRHYTIKHPELPNSTISQIYDTIYKGQTWCGELIDKKKCGTDLKTLATIAPVISSTGEIEKIIWSRVDISHIKPVININQRFTSHAEVEMLENIKYARNIQDALLPSKHKLKEIFKSSFVFSNAQNTVSGDFYWFNSNKTNNNNLLILGDATGHGVSASYLTLLSISRLYNIVQEKSIYDVEKVVDRLNSFLYKILSKDESSTIFNSIDAFVCSYNNEDKILDYLSLGCRGLILRNGEIIELEKSKFSVGGTKNLNIISKRIQMHSGDRVFVFSDGFTDQFGGIINKKLGIKRVREYLANTSSLTLESQKEMIIKKFEQWKGNFEQTDDVTLIGFEIE
jgi:PAS domain S-box-containing protein